MRAGTRSVARVMAVLPWALASVAASPSASADVFGGQIHYLSGETRVHELGLTRAPWADTPRELARSSSELWGWGRLRGVDARFDVLLDDTRFGGGLAHFGLDDVSVRTTGLAEGVKAAPTKIWGDEIEAFVGKEIGQGPVYPYVDLIGSYALLQVDLESKANDQLTTTRYLGHRAGLGLRFGVLIPIGHSSMVDVTATEYVIGGVTTTRFALGLGFWENDRHDDFSQYLRGHPWRGQI